MTNRNTDADFRVRIAIDIKDISREDVEIFIPVFTRKDGVLIRGMVERDTKFATFPPGTPIKSDPDLENKDCLVWLKGHDLLDQDERHGFKLRRAVQFVNLDLAMKLFTGHAGCWLGLDHKPINPDNPQQWKGSHDKHKRNKRGND